MDTAHWPQEIGMKPMEDHQHQHQIVLQNSTNNNSSKPSSNSSSLERRTVLARPTKESAINCPRCNSTNTKFCYYNNYSLSQPRYFCKTCRRYWTEGGSLRNVPVGGGSRKNKRSSISSSHNSSISKKLPDLVLPPNPSQNPKIHHHIHHEYGHGQDLNLGFQNNQDFKTISELIQVPNFIDGNKNSATTNSTTTNSGSATTTTNSAQLSALELLTGMTTRGGGNGNGMMNSFMPIPIPDPNSVYSIPPMPEFKIPSLSFSLDGNGMGGNGSYGSGIQESSSGRLLFPFEDLKTSSTTTTTTHGDQQNRDQNGGDTNGFWSGMLGGNSW